MLHCDECPYSLDRECQYHAGSLLLREPLGRRRESKHSYTKAGRVSLLELAIDPGPDALPTPHAIRTCEIPRVTEVLALGAGDLVRTVSQGISKCGSLHAQRRRATLLGPATFALQIPQLNSQPNRRTMRRVSVNDLSLEVVIYS